MQSTISSEKPEKEEEDIKQKMQTTTGSEESEESDSKRYKRKTTIASEELEESDSKKLKTQTTTSSVKPDLSHGQGTADVDVNFKYYSPSSIFDDNNDPEEMGGSTNIDLALSFYHSRYDTENKLKTSHRANYFDRNAGAAQLYKQDGKTVHTIPEKEGKEYNFVSFGNKEFKWLTNNEFGSKRSSYGHSERILMKNMLDDLMNADADGGELRHPSAYSDKQEGTTRQLYEVLRSLKTNANEYKRYLEKKGLIVKMWSERPACEENVKSWWKLLCIYGEHLS